MQSNTFFRDLDSIVNLYFPAHGEIKHSYRRIGSSRRSWSQ